MFRKYGFLLVLLAAACSPGPSTDLVVYRPALREVDGHLWTRALILTGEGEAVGVERTVGGQILARSGRLPAEDWLRLREELTPVAGLRAEPSRGTESGVLSLFARLGNIEVSLRRGEGEEREQSLAAALGSLDALWADLDPSPEAAESLLQWTRRPVGTIRREALVALLSARGGGTLNEDQVRRTERAARDFLDTEDDPQFREMIRKSLR